VERPPTGQAGGGGSSPNLLADGKGGKTETAAAFSDEVGVPVAGVGRERKLKRKCIRRKRRQGGCSGLRSPWRGSRRRRWPDNGGGALRQRHSAQTATWSSSDMRDGAVGTGVREARRGEGGIGNAVASLDTARSETADRNGF
jgi:hypothetical protein